jgi:hypothetical protein
VRRGSGRSPELRRAAGWLTATAAATLAYRLFLRSWHLTRGATRDEVERRLPGDDLLEDANSVATRAIGIDAPPAAVWPWLVQMGSGRGGA